MKKIRISALLVGLSAMSGSLFAHPGHGIWEGTPSHYLTSLSHLIPVISVLLIIWIVIRVRMVQYRIKARNKDA